MPIAIVSNHSEDLALSLLNTVDNSKGCSDCREAQLVVNFGLQTKNNFRLGCALFAQDSQNASAAVH
jgi:hypothetical protein